MMDDDDEDEMGVITKQRCLDGLDLEVKANEGEHETL